mmetsp:Transcript_4239/g.4992  ORF Transcript_4239/g.4992 Transcript_4239/m.4992 type:complete len:199 (-) Transcript_4239:343-939(-)|eukprot:CAMPEP_0185769582 /NCGR_PEP_ID=MMETSP1174-20130828/54829_1 /TAXON_ID=35687 /ORGANISM="Dictyocha speculum, Strain CCMP1381" /LENGTH=198 /DNA_ID=CAMNT_0028454699 /DNA_START=61 /DNA_END=657 /DNA_ORIENTATION=-
MMSLYFALLLAGTSFFLADGMEISNTEEFFTEVYGTRSSFIKFRAPWCGHCNQMKPDWSELEAAYENSEKVFIGAVDCTKDITKEICSGLGVKGYPTLKYFTVKTGPTGELYSGPRSLDALKDFVRVSLENICDASDPEITCSEKEQAFISKMEDKEDEELQAEQERLKKLLEDANSSAEAKSWIETRIKLLDQIFWL